MGITLFRFVTMHAFDRGTDGRTVELLATWLIRACSA